MNNTVNKFHFNHLEDNYFENRNPTEVLDLLYYFSNNYIHLEVFQQNSSFDKTVNSSQVLVIDEIQIADNRLKLIPGKNTSNDLSVFKKNEVLVIKTISSRFYIDLNILLISENEIFCEIPNFYYFRKQKTSRRIKFDELRRPPIKFKYENSFMAGEINDISETGLSIIIALEEGKISSFNENDSIYIQSIFNKRLFSTIQAKIIYTNAQVNNPNKIKIGVNFYDEIEVDDFLTDHLF